MSGKSDAGWWRVGHDKRRFRRLLREFLREPQPIGFPFDQISELGHFASFIRKRDCMKRAWQGDPAAVEEAESFDLLGFAKAEAQSRLVEGRAKPATAKRARAQERRAKARELFLGKLDGRRLEEMPRGERQRMVSEVANELALDRSTVERFFRNWPPARSRSQH